LPIQVICDSNCKFLYTSARCVGSTHGSLAWAVSILGQRVQDGSGLGIYWLAGALLMSVRTVFSPRSIKLNYRTESSEIVATLPIFSFELAYARQIGIWNFGGAIRNTVETHGVCASCRSANSFSLHENTQLFY
jgi:hypothetical protein